MWPNLVLVVYCLIIVVGSVAGGAFPSLVRLTHTRMQMMMSGVAGLMLGVALLHMIPHAAAELPSLDWAMTWTLFGLLVMFFLIRIFHFHQHHAGDDEQFTGNHDGHACSHDHDHGHPHVHSLPVVKSDVVDQRSVSWVGLAFGLSVHTLIDGMALAASVAADAHVGNGSGILGIGTFLAVVLHKPLDAMSITTMMAASGWPAARQRAANLLFAVMCPLGAAIFWVSATYYLPLQHELLGCALAFSAGVFLCISLGDLLPEVHFHTHDRTKLSIALGIGVALAWLVGFLEPKHGRPNAVSPKPQQQQVAEEK